MSNKTSSSLTESVLTLVGAVAFVPLVSSLSALVSGYVVSTLWGWFIVPVFGIKALSIPQAIGLSLVTGYLTHQTMPEDTASTAAKITNVILYPMFALGIGYVVHHWFM